MVISSDVLDMASRFIRGNKPDLDMRILDADDTWKGALPESDCTLKNTYESLEV